jgi:hypothetical protein
MWYPRRQRFGMPAGQFHCGHSAHVRHPHQHRGITAVRECRTYPVPPALGDRTHGTGNRSRQCAVKAKHGPTRETVEPMTGIEPAYSAWEVDLGCPGLIPVVHGAG